MRPSTPARGLTDAERRVVDLLPTTLTTGQIATRTGINENTVKTHLVRISKRWQVRGRMAIVVRAYELGMLPLPTGPELVALRVAMAEIGRLAAVDDGPDGATPEAVVDAVRARLAADADTRVSLPADWRTQVESSEWWSANNVIGLIEEWQVRA